MLHPVRGLGRARRDPPSRALPRHGLLLQRRHPGDRGGRARRPLRRPPDHRHAARGAAVPLSRRGVSGDRRRRAPRDRDDGRGPLPGRRSLADRALRPTGPHHDRPRGDARLPAPVRAASSADRGPHGRDRGAAPNRTRWSFNGRRGVRPAVRRGAFRRARLHDAAPRRGRRGDRSDPRHPVGVVVGAGHGLDGEARRRRAGRNARPNRRTRGRAGARSSRVAVRSRRSGSATRPSSRARGTTSTSSPRSGWRCMRPVRGA